MVTTLIGILILIADIWGHLENHSKWGVERQESALGHRHSGISYRWPHCLVFWRAEEIILIKKTTTR